jgi:hypothetical protein
LLGTQRPRKLFDSALRALVSQKAGRFDDEQGTSDGVPFETVEIAGLADGSFGCRNVCT